ncbi:hypothetical protein [Legionella fallonii]|uniref:Uncharacterized protein n=1 Tax=Legionella fallonii LLAP-10 TaxID=1212491 RepID=A0A098G135_9GAMM|nr:hypothetical protein [Legionella fallonii]CEG56198.1 protein of unknown function [Legionella fallonii LLAP-10]
MTIYLYAVGLKGNEEPYQIPPDPETGQRQFNFKHAVFEGKREMFAPGYRRTDTPRRK